LAVAPGEYRVLVRHGGWLTRCEITTGSGPAVVDLARCPSEPIVIAGSKGGSGERARAFHVELAGVIGDETSDGFTDTLRAFGYGQYSSTSAGLALSVLERFDRRLWFGGFA